MATQTKNQRICTVTVTVANVSKVREAAIKRGAVKVGSCTANFTGLQQITAEFKKAAEASTFAKAVRKLSEGDILFE